MWNRLLVEQTGCVGLSSRISVPSITALVVGNISQKSDAENHFTKLLDGRQSISLKW